jgi:hypothetical protein
MGATFCCYAIYSDLEFLILGALGASGFFIDVALYSFNKNTIAPIVEALLEIEEQLGTTHD